MGWRDFIAELRSASARKRLAGAAEAAIRAAPAEPVIEVVTPPPAQDLPERLVQPPPAPAREVVAVALAEAPERVEPPPAPSDADTAASAISLADLIARSSTTEGLARDAGTYELFENTTVADFLAGHPPRARFLGLSGFGITKYGELHALCTAWVGSSAAAGGNLPKSVSPLAETTTADQRAQLSADQGTSVQSAIGVAEIADPEPAFEATETMAPQHALVRLGVVTVADLIRASDVSTRLRNMLFRTDRFDRHSVADMLEGRLTEADILRLPDLGRTTYRELKSLVDDYVVEIANGRDILATRPAPAPPESGPQTHVLDGLTVGDLADHSELPIRIANRLATEPALRSFPLASLARTREASIQSLKQIAGLGGKSLTELANLVDRMAQSPPVAGGTEEDTEAPPEADTCEEDLPSAAEEVAGALAALNERHRQVVEARYGLDGEPPRTLQEIATKVFVTRERVRQVEKKALQQLSRRPWRHGFERMLLERQSAAWAMMAGGDALLPADDLGPRTRDLDPRILLAADVVHGGVRAWLDSFGTPAPGGWLPPGGSAVTLREDADALLRAIDATCLPRPFEEICREGGLMPTAALPALSLLSGLRLHDGYVHAGFLGSKARRAARMHREALENRLQVFDVWKLSELDAKAAHDDERSPRMIAMQLDENPHLFHRLFDCFWAVLPAQGPWPGVPLALPALSDAALTVNFDPGTLSAWLHDTLAREGPQRHVDLRDRAVQQVPGISKSSIGPILQSHPVFVRCAPGVYALRGEQYVGVANALLTTGQARTYARALRSGVTRNQFPAWGGAFEWRICEWARNAADGDVFRSLLQVSTPEDWPAPDAVRTEWTQLRQLHGCWMLPTERRGALGPDAPSPAEFLSGILHVALLGSIGWISAGRVTQARLGAQDSTHLLALLGACGAVDCPEDWQAPHVATPRIHDLLGDLTTASCRRGELSWSDAPLADLLDEAANNPQAVRWADPSEVSTMVAALQNPGVRTRRQAEGHPGGSALAGVEDLFASDEWDRLFQE